MAVFLLVVVLLVLVALVLASPWRRAPGARGERRSEELRSAESTLGDLLAARDQKYQEIRDAELDRQTGKLSDADFHSVDAGLRAEAVEILRALDRAEGRVERLRRRQAEAGSEGPHEDDTGNPEGAADGSGAADESGAASGTVSLGLGGGPARTSAGSATN